MVNRLTDNFTIQRNKHTLMLTVVLFLIWHLLSQDVAQRRGGPKSFYAYGHQQISLA